MVPGPDRLQSLFAFWAGLLETADVGFDLLWNLSAAEAEFRPQATRDVLFSRISLQTVSPMSLLRLAGKNGHMLLSNSCCLWNSHHCHSRNLSFIVSLHSYVSFHPFWMLNVIHSAFWNMDGLVFGFAIHWINNTWSSSSCGLWREVALL